MYYTSDYILVHMKPNCSSITHLITYLCIWILQAQTIKWNGQENSTNQLHRRVIGLKSKSSPLVRNLYELLMHYTFENNFVDNEFKTVIISSSKESVRMPKSMTSKQTSLRLIRWNSKEYLKKWNWIYVYQI